MRHHSYNAININEKISLINSIRKYESQTDSINNFVVYANEFFYWGNLDKNEDLRSVKLTNNDIDTSKIVDITLSGNKAVLLYNDRVDYYRIKGTGLSASGTSAIELLSSKTFITPIGGDGQFRFGLSCLCSGLKRFACYSSTLNCLIVKKAGTACGLKDIPSSMAP